MHSSSNVDCLPRCETRDDDFLALSHANRRIANRMSGQNLTVLRLRPGLFFSVSTVCCGNYSICCFWARPNVKRSTDICYIKLYRYQLYHSWARLKGLNGSESHEKLFFFAAVPGMPHALQQFHSVEVSAKSCLSAFVGVYSKHRTTGTDHS